MSENGEAAARIAGLWFRLAIWHLRSDDHGEARSAARRGLEDLSFAAYELVQSAHVPRGATLVYGSDRFI